MSTPFLDLSFAPCLRLVSRVRGFVGEFYGTMLKDEDLVARLEMATHEMLENAVKGSIDGLARIRIELVSAPTRKLVLCTWNRARPEDMEQVTTRIDGISTAKDSFAYYQTLLESTATRTDGSGLGLGRVSAEGEMTLRHSTDGDLLCITAEVAVVDPAERRA